MGGDRVTRALGMFVDEFLPACEAIGRVALCYAQGSLVSGYASDADLDVIVVWEDDVPPERSWLRRLHDGDEPSFFTYDAPDLAIDRLWRDGQEFNLGHHSRRAFERHMSRDAVGAAVVNDRSLQQIRSGFLRGRVVADTGLAEECREAIQTVPAGYTAEAVRRARNDWAYARTELTKAASQADELVFATVVSQSVLIQVVAVFALAGQYYPGPKWVRRVMDDVGVDDEAKALYDRLWHSPANRLGQIAAIDALADWITCRQSQ